VVGLIRSPIKGEGCLVSQKEVFGGGFLEERRGLPSQREFRGKKFFRRDRERGRFRNYAERRGSLANGWAQRVKGSGLLMTGQGRGGKYPQTTGRGGILSFIMQKVVLKEGKGTPGRAGTGRRKGKI